MYELKLNSSNRTLFENYDILTNFGNHASSEARHDVIVVSPRNGSGRERVNVLLTTTHRLVNKYAGIY
jgi:hypothetical protein